MSLRLLLLLPGLFLLSACSGFDLSHHEGMRPQLKPETFFSGHLTAHGVIKDRSGQVIRYFNADIEASWEDGVGTFAEVFVFDDGEQQERVWVFKPTAAKQYAATAGDVVGVGAAEVAGNAMGLNYTLRVPYGDDFINVNIEDRMYLVNDTTLISESDMYKFGFSVGKILLVINKHE